MNKPQKPNFFYCEIYMVNIYFYQEVSARETVVSMKKYLDTVFSEERFDGAAGKALQLHTGDFIIWTREKASKVPTTLAHECLHIANMILHARGITIDTENDEVQAYLLGWLMKKCLGFKNK